MVDKCYCSFLIDGLNLKTQVKNVTNIDKYQHKSAQHLKLCLVILSTVLKYANIKYVNIKYVNIKEIMLGQTVGIAEMMLNFLCESSK